MSWFEFIRFDTLDTLLFRVLALIVAITAHEYAHAAAAGMLGDPTPRERGRRTLNPLAHIDALGLAMVLFGPFGWGKPVPWEPERLRPGKRVGGVIVSLAGPAVNLVLGIFFWWLYFKVPVSANSYDSAAEAWVVAAKGLLQYSFIVNMMLFMIHLFPLYPLDGWRVVRSLSPAGWSAVYDKYEKPGLVVVIAFMVTPFGQYILQNAYQQLARMVMKLYSIGM